jgi:hypothetical protein
VNERNLSRRLATSVVDALKSQGHILVVKGGAQALARELDELMAPSLMAIGPRLQPRAVLVGEVTSTFGHDAVDEAVEELVARMTRALMDSDHVEDVFAEDNVIRRDIFRTVRDGLLRPAEPDSSAEGEEDEPSIRVRLDTLGYVAATVGKRADLATMRSALEQAAEMVDADFVSYAPDTREATFTMVDAGPDGRLDLEEAVADELSALVEQGLVELPTIERRVDAGRDLDLSEQVEAKARIETVASKTLYRSGCAASWEFLDERTIKITFTPLSDQDARDVDQPVALFARGVTAICASPLAAVEKAPEKAPRSERPTSSKRPLTTESAALLHDGAPTSKPRVAGAKSAVAVAKVERPEVSSKIQEVDAVADEEPRTSSRRGAVEPVSSKRTRPALKSTASKRAAPAAPKRAATKRAVSAAAGGKAGTKGATKAPAKARKAPAKKR